ncbi:cadherin-13 [Cricetulus griseus]|nr:cadherin-13 [Cricetulus griseus]
MSFAAKRVICAGQFRTVWVLLFVETTDVSGKTLEGPVPLEVIVIDQNDNRPIFREGPYVGHVMEGSPTEDS